MLNKVDREQLLRVFLLNIMWLVIGPYVWAGMPPNPDTEMKHAGTADGMSLFPSEPAPGHPGADRYPNLGKGEWSEAPTSNGENLVWDQPEYVNYPGSVEHFRNYNQKYIYPINPCNHRSLIKNFTAAEMPGVNPALIEEFAEPVNFVYRGKPGVDYTGKQRPPVKVVRLKPGGQRLKFQLKPLPIGMYVVRLIGALATPDRDFTPKDLILDMKINDGPNGEVRHYVLRQRGTDNFYALGDFYFHVEDNRSFEIDLGSHPDSAVDLLAHNVDVHDVLAECAKRAGKREPVMISLEMLASYWKEDPGKRLTAAKEGRWTHVLDGKALEGRLTVLRKKFPDKKTDAECLAEDRRVKDDAIWDSFPPLNVNWGDHIPSTTNMHPILAELDARGEYHGFGMEGGSQSSWKLQKVPWSITRTREDGTVATYSMADFMAGRPLPGDPLQTPPWGKRLVDKEGNAHYYYPLAQAACAQMMWQSWVLQDYDYMDRGPQAVILVKGDVESMHEYAINLCRYAYDLPAHAETHWMKNILTHPKDYWWRLAGHEGRVQLYQVGPGMAMVKTYDLLFPFIKDNKVLAESVGRHIPWVKTPEDVIALLDTYLVQYMAKKTMYFLHYLDHEQPAMLAELAAVQNDPVINRPWLDAIFSHTWEYPLRDYGSLQDIMYLSSQRDGTTAIGSYMYANAGGIAAQTSPWLEKCVRFGADPKYRLSDLKRFPRVPAMPEFILESRVAGMYPPHIGDIGGPYSPYGHWFDDGVKRGEWISLGWKWTRDPRFTYCLVNYNKKRSDEPDAEAEWLACENAAKGQRNPFMANRSRILSDWGGLLEGGTDSDDFRFRHAARVRVGRGWGHAHYDTLDLGVWSLGLMLTPDAGARGGYGRPNSPSTMIHNLVMVDQTNFIGHGWIPELADMETVQYLRAQAAYRQVFSRQVALVEADKGRPAKNPPSNPSLEPGATYDPDIVLPHAYVVDVFRAQGGREHAYGFHGPHDDEFTLNTERKELTDVEKEWLKHYVIAGDQWAGVVGPDGLTATFRFARTAMTFDVPGRGPRATVNNPEQAVLGAAYDEKSPRKYLRVHLPGQTGARVLTGRYVSAPNVSGREDGETFRQVHLLRRADKGEAAGLFAAVYEPYAGAPFIREVRLEGTTERADAPVAVRVETADGRHDVHYFGLPASEETILKDGTKVQAGFGYISRDKDGLNQVCLVAGTSLTTKELTVKPAAPAYAAQALAVDYYEKRVTLDRPLPHALLDGAFFEVGRPPAAGHPERWTTFEAVKVETKAKQTVLQWRKDAGLFSGAIKAVRENTNGTLCVTFGMAPSLVAGENTQLVIMNSAGKRSWRCDVEPMEIEKAGVPGDAVIYGEGLTAKDFPVGERVRLYEFGPGDVWRAPTRVSLRRIGPGLYELAANVACEIALTGKPATWSSDGKTWQAIPKNQWSVTEAMLATRRLQLRWE